MPLYVVTKECGEYSNKSLEIISYHKTKEEAERAITLYEHEQTLKDKLAYLRNVYVLSTQYSVEAVDSGDAILLRTKEDINVEYAEELKKAQLKREQEETDKAAHEQAKKDQLMHTYKSKIDDFMLWFESRTDPYFGEKFPAKIREIIPIFKQYMLCVDDETVSSFYFKWM